MNDTNRILALQENKKKYQTMHLVHFVVTLLTGGLWGIIWLLAADSNAVQRNKIDNEINQIADPDYRPKGTTSQWGKLLILIILLVLLIALMGL